MNPGHDCGRYLSSWLGPPDVPVHAPGVAGQHHPAHWTLFGGHLEGASFLAGSVERHGESTSDVIAVSMSPASGLWTGERLDGDSDFLDRLLRRAGNGSLDYGGFYLESGGRMVLWTEEHAHLTLSCDGKPEVVSLPCNPPSP